MAFVEPVKKGGRYTKKEQEERRLEVHKLHFERGKPAVEIAEMLNVNRNTVNDDIKFWYRRRVKNQHNLDFYPKMSRQIQRREIQRDRFFGYLEEAETLEEKIKLEKLIGDIDNRLDQFFSKLIIVDANLKKDF